MRRSRQAGRIIAYLRPSQGDESGCVICRSRRVWCIENARPFCFEHRPELAARAIISPGAGQPRAALRGVFIEKRYPTRRTCERILRLAGRTVPAKKPPRPKKRPRDRRYVR